MKKVILVLTSIFLAIGLQAQVDDAYLLRNPLSISFAVGGQAFGPYTALIDAMNKHGFGDTRTYNNQFGSSTSHPKVYRRLTWEVTISQMVKKRQEIGLNFMYSDGFVNGYNDEYDLTLEALHSNYRLMPVYTLYNTNYKLYVQGGFSLNFEHYELREIVEWDKSFNKDYVNPGIMIGTGVSLSKKTNTYWRIGMNYYALLSKMEIGPYESNTPQSGVKTLVFLKEKIYSHELVIKVIFGFRLKKSETGQGIGS